MNLCLHVGDLRWLFLIAKFNFFIYLQADAPDASKIADKDLIGATVVLITCSYHNQEFIR